MCFLCRMTTVRRIMVCVDCGTGAGVLIEALAVSGDTRSGD